MQVLHAITNKIGNKARWLDYAAVRVRRDDPYGNAARAAGFELRRQLAKIGKPVDKTDWSMSQPTVNAYYDPQANDINFPAGILQPPFWDNRMDDAVNFGAGQRFFLGWAQVWCQNITEANLRLRAQTDSHAPARFRVNGVVSNMPEFQRAFACRARQAMVRGPACRVW
jgi:predicted metalloendopeptidase